MQKYLNQQSTVENHLGLLLRELEFSENWTSTHVSDFSGFHYRQYLLEQFGHNSLIPELTTEICGKGLEILNKFLNTNDEEVMDICNINCSDMLHHLYNYKACSQDLNNEARLIFLTMLLVCDLIFCQRLLETFSHHESVFCHRRYILHTILTINKNLNPLPINTKIDLNKLYKQQQCNSNIVTSLEIDQVILNSPKKTKHEYNLNRLLRAVINNEKRLVNDSKYLKWCQFILQVPLG